MISQNKIDELTRLCPGCEFEVRQDQTIRILEYGQPFIVDLIELAISTDQWFDDEIAKRSELAELIPDEPFNIFCSQCGKVNIGHSNYSDQMNRANDKWYCPSCGNTATFDDDSYEAYYDKSNS